MFPKWLLVIDESNHILTALSSNNLMLVGTLFRGLFIIVIVDVPLNVVELPLTSGLPISLKFDTVCVWHIKCGIEDRSSLHVIHSKDTSD